MIRPSVSRMREIRTSGLKGDLRKRSQCATAPEVYQWRVLKVSPARANRAVSDLRVKVPSR
jgi:hypothetical protein